MKGFSLGQHSFLVGRAHSTSLLNFLSLMLPSCVSGLSPVKTPVRLESCSVRREWHHCALAGSASREVGSCVKISAHFICPVSFNKLHHRAMGSAILIPAFGWTLSAAFDLS